MKKLTSLHYNLLVETMENLSKDIKEMQGRVNSLTTNMNTLHNQTRN
jgi:hypothetical protein